MRYGVFFPTAKIGNDPMALKTLATTVEAMGYDFIGAPDHVIQAGQPIEQGWRAQYTRDFPHHEPLLLFAFMACATETLRFQTAVLILAQRPAVLVAKQAAELDVLSGGRLELGIGIGWNALEFTALHQTFGNRGRRVEEQIDVMRKLWTQELVTYNGEWHEVEDAGLAPMPIQRPIPLWIGAFDPRAVARAGRLADGWLLKPQLLPGDAETEQVINVFRDAAVEAERDVETLGMGATHPPDQPTHWARHDSGARWRPYPASPHHDPLPPRHREIR